MTQINDDVVAVENAIKYLVNTSESIGYINGSIGELNERVDDSTNADDRESFISQIERLSDPLDSAKDNQAVAIENVKHAFEHYYS